MAMTEPEILAGLGEKTVQDVVNYVRKAEVSA